MRRDRSRVRIVVQLTDAVARRRRVWSHRFEDEVDNVFAMNDRLMTQAAAMIAPALRSVEIERARRKPTSSLTAFDLYLQALPLFRKSLADNREALRLLDKAVELDPSYSAALGFAARCYQFQKLMGWVWPSDPELAEGVRLAHLAAELGTTTRRPCGWPGLLSCNSPPRSTMAWRWSTGRFAQSQFGERVVRELPGAHLYRRPGKAIDHFHESQRLNPLDQSHHVHWNMVGMAYLPPAATTRPTPPPTRP